MAMRIGELAKLAGCQVVTVRYYEQEGLLKPAPRTASNYRVYDESDLERLRFIIHCRRHSISLEEIRQLLALRESPGANCAFAHELVTRQLAHVEKELESLRKLQKELKQLKVASGCERGGCAILARLASIETCPYCQEGRAQKDAPS